MLQRTKDVIATLAAASPFILFPYVMHFSSISVGIYVLTLCAWGIFAIKILPIWIKKAPATNQPIAPRLYSRVTIKGIQPIMDFFACSAIALPLIFFICELKRDFISSFINSENSISIVAILSGLMSLWVIYSTYLIAKSIKFPQKYLKEHNLYFYQVCNDVTLIFVAACWTWLVAFNQASSPPHPLFFLLIVIFTRITLYWLLRLDLLDWKTVSYPDVKWFAISALLGLPMMILLFILIPNEFVGEYHQTLKRPIFAFIVEATLYMFLLCVTRITVRAARTSKDGKRRALIVGAGEAGNAIAFQIQETNNDFKLIGFVDDSDHKQGRRYRGLPVLGKINEIVQIAEKRHVQEIILAIPSLPPDSLRRIMELCEPTKLPLRILPPIRQLISNRAGTNFQRDIDINDLLPRPAQIADNVSYSYLNGKTVLVTGSGSIGSELCQQIVNADAAQLLIVERDENGLFEVEQKLKELKSNCQIIPFLCDIRDINALEQSFQLYNINVVFHAAAQKHVPIAEAFPCEAVKNNVLGTLNLVTCAVKYHIEHFVLVSTDKAVKPTNVMGATKRISELIVNGFASAHQTNMICVRFGNVLGSRGSVVRTMRHQIERGMPVTVTDPDMVRYFMTIPEAVQLILQAGSIGGCGAIFVLDMGHPVRILDLAHDLIRLSGLVPNQDIPINIIGRRPGEKVKEDILSNDETYLAEKTGPFLVTQSQPVDFSHLKKQISKLIQAANLCDDKLVVRLINQIIPECHIVVSSRQKSPENLKRLPNRSSEVVTNVKEPTRPPRPRRSQT